MPLAPYFLAFVTPALLGLGLYLGGAWTWAPVAFVFALLPVLDERIGLDTRNPDEARAGASRRLWDLPLALWVPVQLGVTALVLLRAAQPGWRAWELAGLIVSLGVINGSGGITIAHELMHRRARWARALAELLMASVSYPHFCIEHVLGHHRHVATPRDPASARLGESVFAFYARCVAGSLRSAWHLERERLARAGQAAGTLRDRRLRHGLLVAGAYALAGWAAGPRGLLIFAAQSLVGFSLLEVINYLEHYGLSRRELAPGQYERVRPEHSWNASQRLSNHYLFNLARHADHHANASRPYERLRHRADAPQLPAGYATMLLLALVPPLWFRVMNPRVAAWQARERSGA